MIKKALIFILLVTTTVVLVLSIRENIYNQPKRIWQSLINKQSVPFMKEGNVEDLVFNANTTLIFVVKYMWIVSVGEVKITTSMINSSGGNEVYGLFITAQTQGLAREFYNGRAEIVSHIAKNTLLPLVYKENLYVSDSLDKTKTIVFDHKKLIAECEGKKYKIAQNTFDPLSSIYYLRVKELRMNEEFVINLISKEEIYEIVGKMIKKEDDVNLIEAVLQRKDKSSSHGGKFYLWITDDAMRLPLLIKAWTKAGLITARLVGVSTDNSNQ